MQFTEFYSENERARLCCVLKRVKNESVQIPFYIFNLFILYILVVIIDY